MSFVSRYLPAGSFLNLSGRVELLKRQGGRRKFGIQSLYYEQLYLIGAACFLAWLASLGGQVLWLPSWLAGFSIPGVAIGLAIFIVMLIGPEVILRFAGRLLPFIVTRARDVVIPRLTLAQRLELVARFLLVNIAQGGAAYFVLWSIYPRTPALPGLLLITTAAYPLSRVAGQLAPLVPGGIGVREGAFTFLLGPFLPVQPIILCAAIFRLISVVMELIIVALLSAFERLSPGADDSNYDAV